MLRWFEFCGHDELLHVPPRQVRRLQTTKAENELERLLEEFGVGRKVCGAEFIVHRHLCVVIVHSTFDKKRLNLLAVKRQPSQASTSNVRTRNTAARVKRNPQKNVP